MPYLKSLPEHANAAHIFAMYPHIYKLYSYASRAIMRGPSPLSYADRELIGAYVSALNGCRYCFGAHVKTAELFGVDPSLLEQLLEDIDSTKDIDEPLKPMLHYIKKLVETPYKLVEEDAEKIYAAGWNEDAFHSMVAVCSTFQFMNHLIMGLGINADQQDYDNLGRERFGTDWAPKMPADIPKEVEDVAAVLRACQPCWAFENEASTMAATDAMLNKK